MIVMALRSRILERGTMYPSVRKHQNVLGVHYNTKTFLNFPDRVAYRYRKTREMIGNCSVAAREQRFAASLWGVLLAIITAKYRRSPVVSLYW